MLAHLTLLLSCQLAGEVIARLFAIPVPGAILGMMLLFVPAGVGIMAHLALIAAEWKAIGAAEVIEEATRRHGGRRGVAGLALEARQAASEVRTLGFGHRPHRGVQAGEGEGSEVGRSDEDLLHDRLLGDWVSAVSLASESGSVRGLTL